MYITCKLCKCVRIRVRLLDCLEWPELWLSAHVVPILHLFINLTMSFSFMPIMFHL